MANQNTDALGELLVAKGFAPNLVVLDINHALDVPHGFELSAPWNLPSRLFRFPIEVCRPDGDQPRKIGLRHPLLANHPYVRHVEALLGFEIVRHGEHTGKLPGTVLRCGKDTRTVPIHALQAA